MKATDKVKSETSLSIREIKEQVLEPRRDSLSPSNVKLPSIHKSPVTKSERQLFNSYFSHMPAGAVLMLPTHLREQEGCINYFAKNVYDNRIDRSVPGKREAYDTIRKTMNFDEAERVVETSIKNQFNHLRPKKRGSMYLSEFWTKKQTRKVMKASELGKAYNAAKEVEREGLPARLEKLEKLYEKREDLNGGFLSIDVGKILHDFETQGINAPALRLHRKNGVHQSSTIVSKTETSIFDNEEQAVSIDICKEEKAGKAVSIDIENSLNEEHTNDSMTTRTKSTSVGVSQNLKGQAEKVKSEESIQDLDKNLFSTASSTCVIMVEDGKDLLGSSRVLGEKHRNECWKAKEKNGMYGLETIREIAKGGKENLRSGQGKEGKNVGHVFNGRYNKENEKTIVKKGDNNSVKKQVEHGNKEKDSVKPKGTGFKNGRKNMWIVPQKRRVATEM